MYAIRGDVGKPTHINGQTSRPDGKTSGTYYAMKSWKSIADGVGSVVGWGGTVALFALLWSWLENPGLAFALVMTAWLLCFGIYDLYTEKKDRKKNAELLRASLDEERAQALVEREREEKELYDLWSEGWTKERQEEYEKMMEKFRQDPKKR